jgi:hypothetical protein
MLLQSCAVSRWEAAANSANGRDAASSFGETPARPAAEYVYLYHLKQFEQRLFFLTRDATTLLYIIPPP